MTAAAVDAWREPFERALDADPSDQRVRHDLADHLDELGDPDGEAVRWLAENRRNPTGWDRRLAHSEQTRWDWYATSGPYSSDAPPDEPAGIPKVVFEFLRSFGIYPTRREAEADFCRAFHAARAAGWVPEG